MLMCLFEIKSKIKVLIITIELFHTLQFVIFSNNINQFLVISYYTYIALQIHLIFQVSLTINPHFFQRRQSRRRRWLCRQTFVDQRLPNAALQSPRNGCHHRRRNRQHEVSFRDFKEILFFSVNHSKQFHSNDMKWLA